MNSFHQPEHPASAKVLSLVRLHHGLPSPGGEEVPVPRIRKGTRLNRLWRAGARLNHLSARRRRIAIEEIPAACFPVILELAEGSNFVILRERESGITEGSGAYIVQFPDSREALVRGDRLRELYDGSCVFLSPVGAAGKGQGGPGGIFRRLRERIGSLSWKRGIASSILANLFAFSAAAGIALAHNSAFGGSGVDSLTLGAIGVLMAAAVSAGLFSLRSGKTEDRLSASMVDCALLPVHAIAAAWFAGLAALPLFAMAAVLGIGLIVSRQLGRTTETMNRLRPGLLALCFVVGAAVACALATSGAIAPAFLSAGLVLGTWLVDRLCDGEKVMGEWRLAAMG